MRALGIKGALLDVRPEDEFAMGHILGAVQTEGSRLAAMASTLDPAAEIVAYCRLLSPIVVGPTPHRQPVRLELDGPNDGDNRRT